MANVLPPIEHTIFTDHNRHKKKSDGPANQKKRPHREMHAPRVTASFYATVARRTLFVLMFMLSANRPWMVTHKKLVFFSFTFGAKFSIPKATFHLRARVKFDRESWIYDLFADVHCHQEPRHHTFPQHPPASESRHET